jgi:hypothetical protein
VSLLVHSLLARLNWLQGNVAQAATHCTLALERAPDKDVYRAELYAGKCAALLHLSRWKDASEAIVRAIDIADKAAAAGSPLDWDHAHYWLLRAIAYRMSGDALRASKDCEKFLSAAGRFAHGHRFLADGLYEAGAAQLARRSGAGGASGTAGGSGGGGGAGAGGPSARSYYERAKLAEDVRDEGESRKTGVPSDARAVLTAKFGKTAAAEADEVKKYKSALEALLTKAMADKDLPAALKEVDRAIAEIEAKRKEMADEKKSGGGGGGGGDKAKSKSKAVSAGRTLTSVAEDNIFLSKLYSIRSWCHFSASPVANYVCEHCARQAQALTAHNPTDDD